MICLERYAMRSGFMPNPSFEGVRIGETKEIRRET